MIRKIAWIFPELEVYYCDEDFGYNVGEYVFKDTDVLNVDIPEGGSKEAYELAMNITQTTLEDNELIFNSDTNTYEYKYE